MMIRTKLLIYMLISSLLILPLYLWLLYVLFYLDDSQRIVNSRTTDQNRIISELVEISQSNPEALITPSFFNSRSKEFAKNKISILIYVNQTLVYQSPSITDKIENQLLEFKHQLYSSDRYPLTFSDNKQGSLYIFSGFNSFQVYMMKYLPSVVTIYVGVVVIVNGILALMILRSIIRPMAKLMSDVNKIKEGDLATPISLAKHDEFGQIANTLEDMRVKVKSSIEELIDNENKRRWALASLTHDIKTPLMIIKGYLKGILDGVANTEERKMLYLNKAYNNLEKFEGSIDNILLYYKLNLNQIPFHFEKVNLEQLIQKVIEKLKVHSSLYKINIELFNDLKSDAFVIADKERVEEVILNIYQNTVKFANKSPIQFRITLQENDEHITTYITDNGPGINQEDIPQIFNSYYRTEKAQSKYGSGLGLAIAYETIICHNGEIGADSRVGEGLTIWFSLKKAD